MTTDPLDALRDELATLDALRSGDHAAASRLAADLQATARDALRAVRVDEALLLGGTPKEAARALGVIESKVYELRAEARKAGRVQDPKE